MKNEVDRQLAAAKVIINKSKSSLSTKAPLLINDIDPFDEEQDDDEESISVENFLEDFYNNPHDCAFPSSTTHQCVTNEQVYQMIHNRSDLMKVSTSIEQQLHKPHEHICTSIDLSNFFIKT